MFPERRPDVHHIAVKFRCSHTELQKHLWGYVKLPSTQQPMIQQHKRQRVLSFEETDNDTENVAPKRKLRIRKARIRK